MSEYENYMSDYETYVNYEIEETKFGAAGAIRRTGVSQHECHDYYGCYDAAFIHLRANDSKLHLEQLPVSYPDWHVRMLESLEESASTYLQLRREISDIQSQIDALENSLTKIKAQFSSCEQSIISDMRSMGQQWYEYCDGYTFQSFEYPRVITKRERQKELYCELIQRDIIPPNLSEIKKALVTEMANNNNKLPDWAADMVLTIHNVPELILHVGYNDYFSDDIEESPLT